MQKALKKMGQLFTKKKHSTVLAKELKTAQDYLVRKGAVEEAEIICLNYLKNNTDDVDAYRMLVVIYNRQNKNKEVILYCNKILEIEHDDIWTLRKLANAYSRSFDYEKSILIREKLVKLTERNNTELLFLASEYSDLPNKVNDAIDIYKELLGKDPSNQHYIIRYAHCLNTAGDVDKAIDVLNKSLMHDGDKGVIYWNLANLKTYKFSDEQIATMEDLVDSVQLKPDNAEFHFYALGKAFEDRKEYEKSFNYYERANTIASKKMHYDIDFVENRYNWTKKIFTKEFASIKRNHCLDVCPIFIVGMHRSGSTLIEQILASHKLVQGTKELPFIIDIDRKLELKGKGNHSKSSASLKQLQKLSDDEIVELAQEYLSNANPITDGARIFIDKMPVNFLHIGLILMMFPKAKIIDARRHPLDVGLSNYRQALNSPHTANLFNLGHFYKFYVKTMQHWKTVFPNSIYRIQYENMVNDPDEEIKKLLIFCGLPDDQNCYRFYETERSVKTPSANQVRQPIYAKSVEKWKHYDSFLKPLKDSLGDILESYNENL